MCKSHPIPPVSLPLTVRYKGIVRGVHHSLVVARHAVRGRYDTEVRIDNDASPQRGMANGSTTKKSKRAIRSRLWASGGALYKPTSVG